MLNCIWYILGFIARFIFCGAKMKILFDKSWFGFGGIGRFASSIYDRLSNNDISCIFFLNPTSLKMPILLSMSTFFHNKNSVLFLPGYIPPLLTKTPFVFTIHDLNHLDRNENSSLFKRLFYQFVIKPGCFKASFVLTVSEFSKNRIVEWSGISQDKVINVGNGVDDSFHPSVQPYQPGYEYLFCVSNRKLHKNEPRIIKAFFLANIPASIKLVMTGSPTEELSNLINEYQLSERVVFIGKVPEDDLPSLYKGSLCLVFPSLYEGFGLPVVEAMACGIPVLTSNTTSLPEVAGDAAILVNPESVDEIKTGIEKLVSDQALRENLIAKGLERAKLFSWDGVAARVQAVLDEVPVRHEK